MARLTALLRAFELGTPEDFERGEFLDERAPTQYPRTMTAVRMGPEAFDAFQSGTGLQRFFWWLLRYRAQAERLLGTTSGILESSVSGMAEALMVMIRSNEGVEASLAEVDAVLLELMDPSGRQVPERELVERWGWPKVDIDELRRREEWGIDD